MDRKIQQEIERLPGSPVGSFIERLAERIGGRSGASAVFGEPVERDGVTVIPVARARWGFGGGEGSESEKRRSGAGGGGGAMVAPVGYVELTGGGSRFRAIRAPSDYMPLVLAGGAVLVALARALRPRR